MVKKSGLGFIECENDTFRLEEASKWSLKELDDNLPKHEDETADEIRHPENQFPDYDKLVKHLVLHRDGPPSNRETPYFNHHSFYANLWHYDKHNQTKADLFGKDLLYGEVVTSTNTLLEKYAAT